MLFLLNLDGKEISEDTIREKQNYFFSSIKEKIIASGLQRCWIAKQKVITIQSLPAMA